MSICYGRPLPRRRREWFRSTSTSQFPARRDCTSAERVLGPLTADVTFLHAQLLAPLRDRLDKLAIPGEIAFLSGAILRAISAS